MALDIEQLLAEVREREDVLPKPRVLVIDDEPAILDIMERSLNRAQLPVITATTGELGLSLLESEPSPGVVFVDKNLPDISGVEVIRRGRQIEPDAQFIMITGYASVESVVEVMDLGAFGYITKPFTSVTVIPERAKAAIDKTRRVLYNRVLLARLQAAYTELHAEHSKLTAEHQRLRDKLATTEG